MGKYAEVVIDGISVAIVRKPKVKEKDGAIEVKLSPTILLRLAPDTAKMVADAFSNWQYEEYS